MGAREMTGAMERNPEHVLALSYAPRSGAAALEALLALDEALAQLLRTTREPALGQLRLAWWREALARLDSEPAPAEPVLRALAREVLPRGVKGASLVPIVHGWEVLIEEETLDRDALRRFGEGRGELFVVAGTAMGAAPNDPLAEAGQGWALVDLAAPSGARRGRRSARPRRAAAENRHLDTLEPQWSGAWGARPSCPARSVRAGGRGAAGRCSASGRPAALASPDGKVGACQRARRA
jgi:phytoene synthase